MASKQVTFRNIKLEGFRSYSQPVSFSFANTGLHLIKGLNGGGKTSLFSALVWALYKVNLNDTNNTKIPTFRHKRTKGYKGTRVQVLMGIGKYKYLIARHIDFKDKTCGIEGADSLLIFRKEKVDKNPFTAKDILNEEGSIAAGQEYLNKILGIDAKTFLNSVIFGQRMNRLMDSKDADKRDLFERLFDVDFIDALADKAKSKILDANSILTQLNQDLAIANNKRETISQQLEDAHRILEEFESDKKNTLDLIRKRHTIAKTDVEALDAQIILAEKLLKKSGKTDTVAVLAEASNQASEIYYNAKSELAIVQRDIDECIHNQSLAKQKLHTTTKELKDIATICPTCGSPIPAGKLSQAKQSLREVIEELTGDTQRYQQQHTTLGSQEDILLDMVRKTLAAYEKALDAYNTAKQQNNGIESNESSLAVLQERRNNKKQEVKRFVAEYNTERDKESPVINVYEITRKLEDANEQIPALEKAIRIKNNLVTRLAWWQKAFGANGLRSYVFSSQLNNLNSCVGVYTAYFRLSIVFGIELDKASKNFFCRVSLDGKNEVDYNTLSGGEKGRVDLCISFGLQDSAESLSSFNISIMDEPEVFLDADTLETLNMLIRIRAEHKAVYIISHNSQMDLTNATVFTISGGNKGTSIIE